MDYRPFHVNDENRRCHKHAPSLRPFRGVLRSVREAIYRQPRGDVGWTWAAPSAESIFILCILCCWLFSQSSQRDEQKPNGCHNRGRSDQIKPLCWMPDDIRGKVSIACRGNGGLLGEGHNSENNRCGRYEEEYTAAESFEPPSWHALLVTQLGAAMPLCLAHLEFRIQSRRVASEPDNKCDDVCTHEVRQSGSEDKSQLLWCTTRSLQ